MHRLAAIFSALLGIGLIVVAILGPLGLEMITFHMNRNAIVQYEGGEVITIAAALRLLYCAYRWWRQDSLAAALTAGATIYAIYTMMTVVMGQEFTLFPDGNVERYFPLFMALTALGTVLLVLCMNALIQQRARISDGWRRATQWVLGIQITFFALAWISEILATYPDGLTDEQAEGRLLYWLIKYLDLGFMIPLAFVAIILLHYRQPLAHTIVLGLSGYLGWMMLAIAARAVNQHLQDEPGGSLPLAGVFTLMAVAATVVWIIWTRALADKPD